MPLTYENGRWYEDGKARSLAWVIEYRDAKVAAWADELKTIAAEELGAGVETPLIAITWAPGSVNRFGQRFVRRIAEFVTQAYIYAAGGMDRMTDAAWARLAGINEAQETFAQGFLGEIRGGSLTAEQVQSRAAMYSGGAIEAFETARLSQIDDFDYRNLPAMPGDGSTPCLTNCRCMWSIEDTDDGWDCTWVDQGGDNECEGCKERAETWSPYTVLRS